VAKNIRRKLAAILAADVIGYSRLMGEDEADTLDALRTRREELVEPKITVECCLAHLAQSAVARWHVCWSTRVTLREPWIS
jgi:hypothetical protein